MLQLALQLVSYKLRSSKYSERHLEASIKSCLWTLSKKNPKILFIFIFLMPCGTSGRAKTKYNVLFLIKNSINMFNAYGWIQLGMNRKHMDIMDEEVQLQYDKLDVELEDKVKSRLQEIVDSNEIIRFDFIAGMNNLEHFLSVQLSRNHFNATLREFYKRVSEISDGSHGLLYEMDSESKDFTPDKPYRMWRLIGDEFEECDESILNEKFHKISY